jgi:hypothetical protein
VTWPASNSSPPAKDCASTDPSGVGKTHLATALAHQACRRGYDAAFITASRLLADLAGGHADGSFTARLKRLAKPAVLAIDDFAMRDFNLAQADDFYDYDEPVTMPRGGYRGWSRAGGMGLLSA